MSHSRKTQGFSTECPPSPAEHDRTPIQF
uniref:Uncharacterized protein n=1 Tax=Anguilla anguilla TaxID=7936 RepID=A0A0E9XQQ7_ANGAN